MTHFKLVTAVEGRYTVSFALGELQELKDVGNLLDLLGRKRDAK